VRPENVIAEYGSGADREQPGMTDLLARVEDGQVTTVVVKRLDRLTRSADSEETRAIFQILLDHAVTVITEIDRFDLGQAEDAACWRLAGDFRKEWAEAIRGGEEYATGAPNDLYAALERIEKRAGLP